MKCRFVILATAVFGFIGSAFAQDFVNLDFEQANVIPIPGGDYGAYSIAVSNALPGWSVYYGANQQSQITYNDPALGSTFVTLYATNGQQLAGNYSVLLQGGGTASAATISQTALVPATAESLLFYGAASSFATPVLLVSLDGQDLSLVALSTGPNYTVYGANVSAFADQVEILTFSAPQISGNVNNWNIDNIQFSSFSIPEPSESALFALGALSLGIRRCRESAR